MSTITRLFGLVAIALVLANCAGKSVTQSQFYEITLRAGPEVNPDEDGRASPILVKVMILSSDYAFKAADFFEVFADPMTMLSTDIKALKAVSLAPGEVHTVEFGRTADAGDYIGVLAGFQNLDNAVWRVVTSVRNLKEERADVALTVYDMSFVSSDKNAASQPIDSGEF